MFVLRIRGTKSPPSSNEPNAAAVVVRRPCNTGIGNVIEFARRNQRGGEFALGSFFFLLVRRIARDTRFECVNV